MRTDRLAIGVVLVSLVLAVSIGGCRRRGSVRGEVASGGGAGGGAVSVGGDVVAHGSPREMLDQFDSVMRGAGYEPVGPASAGTLPVNGIMPVPMDVRRGYCYALAVFGTPGTDVNLVVNDPRGAQVVFDVRPDEHPWVSFCVARAGRFVVRLQQVRGAGEYFFAPYHSARGRTPVSLSAFFGGATTSTAAPTTAAIDAEVSARVSALDGSLSGERFSRVGEPSGLVLHEREERLFSLSLEAGRCYAFATFAGAGALDTDVYLVDGEGHWLAQDARGDRDGLVRFCAPSAGTFTLQIRLLRGEGAVFTAAYLQNTGAAPTADAEPLIAADSVAGASIEESSALIDADMRARGYENFGDAQRGDLGEAGTNTYEMDLEADICYALVAVGDSGVRDIDITLSDASGRTVDADVDDEPRSIVRVCPTARGHYRMAIRMTSGSGTYIYAPYRWTRGTRGPFGLAGVIYLRLAEVTALLGVEGYEPDSAYDLEQGTLGRAGANATHSFRLDAGRCYSVLVVGGEGITDLDVSLSRNGSEVASDVGVTSAFPSVRYCTDSASDVALRVTAAGGSGPYLYQIFSITGTGGSGY